MAASVWGRWQILVAITAMTASTGAFIPGATAASRVVFAMAREGKLPRRLASVHPRTQAPHYALHIVYGVTLLALFPAVFMVGPDKTIDWWGNTFGWFIGIVYTAANLANIIFYARFRRTQFNLIWNLFVPLAAIVIQVIMLWHSVIVHLWESGRVGRANLLLIGVITMASVAYVFRKKQNDSPRPLRISWVRAGCPHVSADRGQARRRGRDHGAAPRRDGRRPLHRIRRPRTHAAVDARDARDQLLDD